MRLDEPLRAGAAGRRRRPGSGARAGTAQRAPEVGETPQAEQGAAMRVPDRQPQAGTPRGPAAPPVPGAAAMSEELKAVVRDMGAADTGRDTKRR